MQFRNYLLRRLLLFIPTLFGVMVLIFLLVHILPGDPARLALGPDAPMSQVISLRHSLGLDKPIHIQFIIFLDNFIHGKMGLSLLTNRDVYQDIAQFYPASLELSLVSISIAIIIGVPLGIISGIKQNKWVDQLSRIVSLFGVSIPRFWLAIMLILIFSFYMRLMPISGRIGSGISPPTHITGLYLIDSFITLNIPAFVSSFKHIILPAISLSVSPLAQIVRLLRAGIIEHKRAPHVMMMKANGMPEDLINRKYLFKISFIPVLSIIGLLFASIIAMSFAVETVFSWPGIGRYGANAVLYADFNAIVGVTIVAGATFIIINFIVDMLYGYFDPRIRYE
jgi:peptide/nickel transport system permease protein